LCSFSLINIRKEEWSWAWNRDSPMDEKWRRIGGRGSDLQIAWGLGGLCGSGKCSNHVLSLPIIKSSGICNGQK
jgi:hypothetical protein